MKTDFQQWAGKRGGEVNPLTALMTFAGRALLSEAAIECGGQTFTPDSTKAWIEFWTAQAFPVVTVDSTAIHPQVVANSFRSMWGQIFNFNHQMRKYNPAQNKKDMMLGSVFAVELSGTGLYADHASASRVDLSGDSALGIRGVAALHKQSEAATEILRTHFSEEIEWAVSMEHQWRLNNSGFLVKQGRGMPLKGFDEWTARTPSDLAEGGWTYVPAVEAPMELLECFDADNARMNAFNGRPAIVLFGGLDGTTHYSGLALTPAGTEKEPGATVGRVLAAKPISEGRISELVNAPKAVELVDLFKALGEMVKADT